MFQGKTVWQGNVEVFDLRNHPKVQRCYPWSHLDGVKDERERFRCRAGNTACGFSAEGCTGSNYEGCEGEEMKWLAIVAIVVAAAALFFLDAFPVAAHRTHAFSTYRELQT
ncbi:MAG: hypothetical protein JWN25_3007 [Verrucomicrobiales bacterium]|nr:hypothetical protein [Verrucomicrobiales bacterium]